MDKIGIRAALAVFLSLLLFTVARGAMPQTLIPGGDTIGLELELKGVSVVELANDIPAKAGLRCGDLICMADGAEISSVEQLTQAVRNSQGRTMVFTVLRNGKEKSLKLSPIQTSDGWKLGVYVRDHLKGIGTVTYYEEDGDFGALGHGVNGGEGNSLLPLKGGIVTPSEVASVAKGEEGNPGCLHGAWQTDVPCGEVERNTPQGIFGRMERSPAQALPVASSAEIRKGPALIRSTVHGREICTYSVEICEIHHTDTHDRNLLLRVTDPALLSATGGIVQGMSGSPIIQDGKLIGAVTHVLIDDPTMGYGIFIENMLDAAS